MKEVQLIGLDSRTKNIDRIRDDSEEFWLG